MTTAIGGPIYYCPVCGFRGLGEAPYSKMMPLPLPESLVPPYGQSLGDPSYEVCDCCGFEFGFDDEPGAAAQMSSFEQYREEWVAAGARWFTPSKRPAGWSLEQQLRDAHLI